MTNGLGAYVLILQGREPVGDEGFPKVTQLG